jgi:hypothetical protein
MAAQIYVNLFIYAYLRYYYNGHIDITTGIIILILIGVCINVYMYIYIYEFQNCYRDVSLEVPSNTYILWLT